MNIVCLHSCAADASSIDRLLSKCSMNVTVGLDGIEGRYVLAYHNSELIGLADLTGEIPTCVLAEYNAAKVSHIMQMEIKKIYEKHAKKYRVALAV